MRHAANAPPPWRPAASGGGGNAPSSTSRPQQIETSDRKLINKVVHLRRELVGACKDLERRQSGSPDGRSRGPLAPGPPCPGALSRRSPSKPQLNASDPPFTSTLRYRSVSPQLNASEPPFASTTPRSKSHLNASELPFTSTTPRSKASGPSTPRRQAIASPSSSSQASSALRAGASREDTQTLPSASSARSLGSSAQGLAVAAANGSGSQSCSSLKEAWAPLSSRSTTASTPTGTSSFVVGGASWAKGSDSASVASGAGSSAATHQPSAPGVGDRGCGGARWLVEVTPLHSEQPAAGAMGAVAAAAASGRSSHVIEPRSAASRARTNSKGSTSRPRTISETDGASHPAAEASAQAAINDQKEEVRGLLWHLEVERLRCATLNLEVQRQVEKSGGLWRQLCETSPSAPAAVIPGTRPAWFRNDGADNAYMPASPLAVPSLAAVSSTYAAPPYASAVPAIRLPGGTPRGATLQVSPHGSVHRSVTPVGGSLALPPGGSMVTTPRMQGPLAQYSQAGVVPSLSPRASSPNGSLRAASPPPASMRCVMGHVGMGHVGMGACGSSQPISAKTAAASSVYMPSSASLSQHSVTTPREAATAPSANRREISPPAPQPSAVAVAQASRPKALSPSPPQLANNPATFRQAPPAVHSSLGGARECGGQTTGGSQRTWPVSSRASI